MTNLVEKKMGEIGPKDISIPMQHSLSCKPCDLIVSKNNVSGMVEFSVPRVLGGKFMLPLDTLVFIVKNFKSRRKLRAKSR